MAEAAWKAKLRQRVESADDRLRGADSNLKAAEAIFQSPVSPCPYARAGGAVAWAAGFRNQIACALMLVMDASEELNSAVVNSQAAEILALHGGNASDPSVAIPSIQDLLQAEPKVHAAMLRIQICRERAEEACMSVDWCRGHLSTATALVDASGIQESLLLAQRECGTAFNALTYALQRTLDAWGEAIAAREILTRPA